MAFEQAKPGAVDFVTAESHVVTALAGGEARARIVQGPVTTVIGAAIGARDQGTVPIRARTAAYSLGNPGPNSVASPIQRRFYRLYGIP